MGSSSSTSSTSQSTTAINPVSLARDNATSVSGVVNGDGNTFNVTTLNAEVANKAMDTVLTSQENTLLFAANAEKNSYGFASRALDSSYAFADAQAKASQTTTMSAIESTGDAYDKALKFGSLQTGVALDALSESANMIKDSYADAKGRGAMTDYLLFAAIAGALVVAAYAVRGKKA